MRYVALALALIACGADEPVEPIESPTPEPVPAPEPPAPVSAPTLEAIPAATPGHARIAEPVLEQGFTYPVRELDAGFGKAGELILIELKPPGEEGLSVQLTFHGETALAPRGYRLLPIAAGESDVFTVALGRTNLRPGAGELHVESVDDETIVATLDLEVRDPMMPTPTQLRARIHARHDAYYDAAIRHQQAIRERLKRR